MRRTSGQRGTGSRSVDLTGVARKVGELSQAARQGRASAMERHRAHHPVEPESREQAVDVLNAAYVRGAIDTPERERRVGLALVAHNRGELLRAVEGISLPSAPRGAAMAAAARELRRTLWAATAAATSFVAAVVVVIILVIVLRGG